MARKRQVRRCQARRTDGAPCGAWSMSGGTVCAAHGGRAPQVRREALVRRHEASTRAAYDRAYQRWRRDVEDWQVRRFVDIARWLGIPPGQITAGDILMAVIEGIVPGEQTMPMIRVDRRYGPRK